MNKALVLCMSMPPSCGTLAVLGRSEKACTKPSANPAADRLCKHPTRIIRATVRPRYKSLAQRTCEIRSDSTGPLVITRPRRRLLKKS